MGVFYGEGSLLGFFWRWGLVEDKCLREIEDGKEMRRGEKKLFGFEF